MSFTPRTQDLASPFPAQSSAHELEEVDIGKNDWGDVCFAQFLCTKSGNVPAVLSAAPGIPLSGGAGTHKFCEKAKGPVEDDAPVATHGDRLDIA